MTTEQSGSESPVRLDSAARYRPFDFRRFDRTTLVTFTIVAVLAGTACRALFAATIDFGTDEAYYWAWSRESVVSFLDHPPMVAWFVRIGTVVFGDTTFGARFMGIPALIVAEILLADVVRRITGDVHAAAFVVLAMEGTLGYGVVVMLVKPDVALLPFAAGVIWTLVRLEETRDPRWWLTVGACGGLALLSKYTAVLVVPAILLFILVPPRNRGWFLSPWLWFGVLVALAIFAPVLWWNAQQDWASFRFQGQRITASTWAPIHAANFALVSLAFIGPLLVPAIVVAGVAALKRAVAARDAVALLVSGAFLVPLAYFIQRSFFVEIIPTWPYFIWSLGIAVAAINAARLWSPGMPGRAAATTATWASAIVVSGYLIVGVAFYHALIDRNAWFGELDLLGREAGYDRLAEDVAAAARTVDAGWIATTDYRTYAMLRWHLRDEFPVVQVTERSRFIGFGTPDDATLSLPALLLSEGESRATTLDLPAAAGIEPVARLDRVWRGVTFGSYTLDRITGWLPDLMPPPGSAPYGWPQLALARGIVGADLASRSRIAPEPIGAGRIDASSLQ